MIYFRKNLIKWTKQKTETYPHCPDFQKNLGENAILHHMSVGMSDFFVLYVYLSVANGGIKNMKIIIVLSITAGFTINRS